MPRKPERLADPSALHVRPGVDGSRDGLPCHSSRGTVVPVAAEKLLEELLERLGHER